MSLKVAVIGGGNGGFATASQMALAGHEVHLFELPDFSANIAELKETPVIEVSGALLTGEAGWRAYPAIRRTAFPIAKSSW